MSGRFGAGDGLLRFELSDIAKGAALVAFDPAKAYPVGTVGDAIKNAGTPAETLFPPGFDPATTDCSVHIQAALNDRKFVQLKPGQHYIAKNLQSVEGAALFCVGGRATIDVPAGAGVIGLRINTSHFTLDGVDFSGGDMVLKNVSAAVAGSRDGLVIGNPFDTGVQLQGINVANSRIYGFDNRGLWGREVQVGFVFGHRVTLHNVCADHNFVNWFADQRFEYVTATSCYGYEGFAGLILIGGNNTWVASHFENNFQNLQMASGENDAHGQCIGCSFNHAAAGGYGVYALGVQNGQTFTGCAFWYSPIYIEDCKGISIRNSQIAGGFAPVTIKGGGLNSIDDNYTPGGLDKTFIGYTFTSFRRNRTTATETAPDSYYRDLVCQAKASTLAYPIEWNATADTVIALNYILKRWHGVDQAWLSPANDVYIPRTGWYDIEARVRFNVKASAERVVLQVLQYRADAPLNWEMDSRAFLASQTDCTVRVATRMFMEAGDVVKVSLRTLTAAGITIPDKGINVLVSSVD